MKTKHLIVSILLVFAALSGLLPSVACAADPLPVQRPQPLGYTYSTSTKTVTIQWVYYAEYIEKLLALRNAEIATLKAAPPADLTPVLAKLDQLLARPAASIAINSGANGFTLIVTANGTEPFTYQWKKDGVPIAGATSDRISIAATAFGTYSCQVSNYLSSAEGAAIIK